MMSGRHEVILYAGEENEAQVHEHVPCITNALQRRYFENLIESGMIFALDWNPDLPGWRVFNHNVVTELRKRIEPRDFLCLITGSSQKRIAIEFPAHQIVEFGIGYQGVLPDTHHVFESYAWMHAMYGWQGPAEANGKFFDAVIPNYYDSNEFPSTMSPGDHYLFMSRMTPRKGYQIAVDTVEKLDARLKIAGIGGDDVFSDHIEHVGLVHGREKFELLAQAKALFVPTLYLEPFGGVAAEALLCGTPVITTDWGAFTEYVDQGVNGFRCRTMKEFVQAANYVSLLDREAIRTRAHAKFTYGPISNRYEQFFERLQTLWGEGFYAY